MKKIISLICLLVLMASSTIKAEEVQKVGKSESVYSVLEANGDIREMYVINHIRGSKVDYGTYIDITNLTSQEEIKMEEEKISIPQKKDGFYYQGSINKKTSPWHIRIQYKVDGEKVDAKEIAGVTGALEIIIESSKGDVNKAYFYNNFMLQINVSLPEEAVKNVEAKGATIVDVAGQKQITYTTFLGSDSSISIKADVNNFEMAPITINGVKMALAIDVEMDIFTDRFRALVEGIKEIDDGASKLKEGARDIEDGFTSFRNGYKTYAGNMDVYVKNGEALWQGVEGISRGLNEVNKGSEVLMEGIKELEERSLENISFQLLKSGIELPKLTKENYREILSANEELSPYIMMLEKTFTFTNGLIAYIEGVKQITPKAETIAEEVKKYMAGAKELNKATKSINNGLWEMNSGVTVLANGLREYREGTNEFRERTENMEQKIADEIDEMLKDILGDDTPLESFVSEKNINIDSVQFFYRTDEIKRKEIEKKIIEKEEKESFWKKVRNLFTSY